MIEFIINIDFSEGMNNNEYNLNLTIDSIITQSNDCNQYLIFKALERTTVEYRIFENLDSISIENLKQLNNILQDNMNFNSEKYCLPNADLELSCDEYLKYVLINEYPLIYPLIYDFEKITNLRLGTKFNEPQIDYYIFPTDLINNNNQKKYLLEVDFESAEKYFKYSYDKRVENQNLAMEDLLLEAENEYYDIKYEDRQRITQDSYIESMREYYARSFKITKENFKRRLDEKIVELEDYKIELEYTFTEDDIIPMTTREKRIEYQLMKPKKFTSYFITEINRLK